MSEGKFNRVIGLVGLPCSGKGTVVDILKGKGFWATSLSDRIREELASRKEEATRERLQMVGGEMRNKYGVNVLAEMTWRKILEDKVKKVVVDAIRSEAEVNYFRKKGNFILLAVTASSRIRFERMKARQRESDPKTWEEFLVNEERDKKMHGRNIDVCMAMADRVIENSGSLDELREKVDFVISTGV